MRCWGKQQQQKNETSMWLCACVCFQRGGKVKCHVSQVFVFKDNKNRGAVVREATFDHRF